jgi:glycosyltransferase involved in cell wall biosynthesis
MPTATPPRIICLSNVYDQAYVAVRGEDIAPALSSPKRRDLFRSLELASGREVIVLSSPPRATRRSPRWLAPVETRFSTDAPKVRVPFSWFTYAWQVLRQTRAGDVVVVDNYEFIYIFAARVARCFRPLTFVLEYEDGKHLIDKSWPGVLSRLAERWGRPLMRAALLAHPNLGARLPPKVPVEVVPGFFSSSAEPRPEPPSPPVRFLYSGSLDTTRGVDLLLAALPELPETGWQLEITGAGPLAERVAAVAAEPRWKGKVTFHGTLPGPAYTALIASCHVGLNCQRRFDSISDVTFPSKIFSYLSAGLAVLSSEAGCVRQICGEACSYFTEETPQALAEAMQGLFFSRGTASQRTALDSLRRQYSIEGTAQRLRPLLTSIGVA